MGAAFRSSPTRKRERGERQHERRVENLTDLQERLESRAGELEQSADPSTRQGRRRQRRAGRKRERARIAGEDLDILEGPEELDEDFFRRITDLQRARRRRTGFGIQNTFVNPRRTGITG